MLLGSIYVVYKSWFWWKTVSGLYYTNDDLINSNIWKQMVFEFAINAVSPMPFLYKVTYEEFFYGDRVHVDAQVNTFIFTIMVLFRIYHVYRVLLCSWYYTSERAIRICFVFGIKNDFWYAVRSLFRYNPWVFWYTHYVCYMFVFGYLLRSIEFEVNRGQFDTTRFSFTNSLWCSFITMTTVGYGDFFPKTFLGRWIGVWAAFVGVALESLVVLTAQKIFILRGSELRSFNLLLRLDRNQLLMKRAVGVISTTYRLRQASEKNRPAAIARYGNSSRKYQQISRQIKAIKAIAREKDNHYVAQELAWGVRECKDLAAALSIYVKNKNLNRNDRRQISEKYEIPGYTNKQKTVAFKPIDMPRNNTKHLNELNSVHSSDSESIDFTKFN